jgi:type I restriction enzyme S subunit
LFDRSKFVKASSKYLFDCEALIVPGEGSEFLPKYYSGKFDLHQRAYALYDLDPKLDIRFLQYYLILNKEYFSRVAVGATVKSLRRRHFADLEIPFPSLSEQKSIVEKLNAAFAGIDELDRVSKSQIALAKNVMASYLDKILNIGGDRSINSLPLGELAEKVVVAYVGSTSQFYAETGVPFLRTQNVTRQGVQVDNLKFVTKEFHEKNIKSQLAAGDVLLSRVITDRVTVGVVPNKIIPSNCANVIIVRPGGRLVPEYLAAYVSSASSQRYLLSRKVGSAQMVVNTGIVKNWPIPVISLEEQKKVSDQIAEMRESVADLQGKLRLESELFDELRSALLHEAFSTESNVA